MQMASLSRDDLVSVDTAADVFFLSRDDLVSVVTTADVLNVSADPFRK